MKKQKFNLKFLIYVLVGFLLLSVSLVLFVSKRNNENSSNISVDFSKLSMACIGDSITYGYDGYIQVEDTYPKIVGESLGLKNAYNLGLRGSTLTLGGNTKFPMCERTSKLNKNLDIITLMGGVNDFHREHKLGTIDSQDVNTIYGALNRIAENLNKNHANAFIVFISPMDFWYDNDADVNSVGLTKNQLVKAIKDVAEKNNFAFLDLYNNSPIYDYNNKLFCLDKVHPTQSYTRNYAQQIAQFIKDNCKK